MSSRSNPSTTADELAKLEQFIKRGREQLSQQRACAVFDLYRGYTPTQVAANLGFNPKTIRAWRRRFLTEGVEGLADRPRSGRPLKGDANYQRLLEETLACDPEDLGLWFTSWSTQRLGGYLERHTGIALSVGRLRLLLKRRGYSYQHYIRTTPNPNPPSMERWQGTGLEQLVAAVFAVRREYRWGWRKQQAR